MVSQKKRRTPETIRPDHANSQTGMQKAKEYPCSLLHSNICLLSSCCLNLLDILGLGLGLLGAYLLGRGRWDFESVGGGIDDALLWCGLGLGGAGIEFLTLGIHFSAEGMEADPAGLDGSDGWALEILHDLVILWRSRY